MSRGSWSGLRVAGATLSAALVLAACPVTPGEDTLRLSGALEREGVAETDLARVAVDYGSNNARGEWWSCELRLTATGCVGDHHVNVWIALPQIVDFNGLGGSACADDQGNAFGVYELLTEKTSNGDPIRIGTDVAVLVLVASDVDADRGADLANDEETTAASRLVSGTVTVQGIGAFDAPITLTIEGQTVDGNDVTVAIDGPTQPVPNPPPLDVARTCVAADLLE